MSPGPGFFALSGKAQAITLKQVCSPTEDGRACREKALLDEGSLDYAQQSKQSVKAAAATNRGFESTDKYVLETAGLVGAVEAFLGMDVYDEARPKLIERLTKEGNAWTGAYAPGGSSKRESGRAFYNALNQLLGWFAFNGFAPLNKATTEKVTRNVADTLRLLEAGR